MLPSALPNRQAPRTEPRRHGIANPALLRWTGVAVLALLVGVAVYSFTGKKATNGAGANATDTVASQADYEKLKPGADAPKPTKEEIQALSVPMDELKNEDGTDGSTIEKSGLTTTDLVDSPKDLAIGQKYNVNTAKGPVTLQFDAAHFAYVDCKVMVVVTDPTGKQLEVIKGLERAEARRVMLKKNDPEHNVETKIDPEQPAKFVARDHDYVITIPGDPATELNDDTKNAFQIDRTFYIANPVKK